MTFRIELSAETQANIEDAYQYIRRHGPANPDEWFNGLRRKLKLLTDFADWSGFAPENEYSDDEIRQVMYGPYRILLLIQGDVVHVITMRHSTCRFLTAEQIDNLSKDGVDSTNIEDHSEETND